MDEHQIPNPYDASAHTNDNIALRKKGFAITALVLGIISICLFCYAVNIFTAPFAIIFGIIALAKKQGGKGMSITGIILASLSLLITGVILLAFKDFFPYMPEMMNDYHCIYDHQKEFMEAYQEDQVLPECLEKYKEPPLSDLLDKYEITIYDFMDVLLDEYEKKGSLPSLPLIDYTVSASE